MNTCPYCQSSEKQVKAGKNKSGSQKYLCKQCGRRYTPEPSQMYSDEIRQQAVKLSVDAMNYRRIARHLGVDHKTVIHWVNAYVAQLLPAAVPEDVNYAEMDELFTFIGSKNRVYLMTIVDRTTSCILAWVVEPHREQETLQQMVDDAPQAPSTLVIYLPPTAI